MGGDIQIKLLRELYEMRAAVELQKIYWGTEVESLVPAHMLFTIANCGGHVLSAMDGGRMIGVLIGLLGTDVEAADRPAMANLLIASKRMVVLPEYRGQGVGYRLKLMQREIAIKQGIRLVTWTYDPLLATNAYLNLRKLGCISQKYLENYYGTEADSGLTTLGASDRLTVEWWVTNRRVEERLNGTRSNLNLRQYLDANTIIVNPAASKANRLIPSSDMQAPMGAFALVEIPLDYAALVKTDESLAVAWRDHSRAVFRHLMQQGYIVVDFLREQYEGRDRGFYLMSYNTGFDLHLN